MVTVGDETAPPPILVVDVAPLTRDVLTVWARRQRLGPVKWVQGIPEGAPSPLGLCVVGVRGRSQAEFEKVRAISKAVRGCALVVLVEDSGIDFAVALIQSGVAANVIELGAERDDLAARILLHYQRTPDPSGVELIGQSPPLRELRERIGVVAPVDSTVLLQGETGTGKGLVARVLHDVSPRREGRFIHVDCAALSPNLVESELFGHERGAFTGAAGLRRGRFELAAGGTIFLDEIGDLDLSLQSKLLRVLQDRSFERVGGTQTLEMHARVIAATSRDLLRAVQEGRFRQDLYFRLDVLKFTIPPLRERVADLPLLVESGLTRLSAELGVPRPRVSDDFYASLSDHRWPGNVRELMNLLERLLVERRAEVLGVEDLDGLLEPLSDTPLPTATGITDTDDEVAVIRAALIETGGVISRAARRLGIPRGTLRYRIRKFGLQHLVPRD